MRERVWPPTLGVFALLLGVILTAYIAGNESRQIRSRQRSEVAAQAGVFLLTKHVNKLWMP